MRTLLDTHAFLWFINGSDRLTDTARNHMVDLSNELVLSVASLWEIAIKTSIGKLELLHPFDQLIPTQLEENVIGLLPITINHLSSLVTLKFYHRDPFDRLIIAQAKTESMPIITGDAAFTNYPVDIIW